jgi:hypothetical protein
MLTGAGTPVWNHHFALTDRKNDAEAVGYANLAVKFGFPPDVVPLPLVFALAAARAGQPAVAAEHIIRMLPPELAAPTAVRCVYSAFAAAHERPAAVAALDRLVTAAPIAVLHSSSIPMLIVGWFAQLGSLELAFDLANRSLDECAGRGSLPPNWQTLWLPELQTLRSDVRFKALAARLGYTQYWSRFGPADSQAASDSGCGLPIA